MRSRFVGTVSEAAELLLLLRLAPPPVSSAPPPPPPEFVDLVEFDYSVEFDTTFSLPIHKALSTFLEHAIPVQLDPISLQGNNVYTLDPATFELTQPLDQGNTIHFQTQIMPLHQGVPNLELRLQNSLEIHRAVYTIDDVLPDYSTKQQPHSPEDNEDSLGTYHSSNSRFPHFELHLVREQIQIFNSIEAQKCLLEVEQIVNDKDDTMYLATFDLLENMSHHLELSAIVELPPLDFFQEMELMVSIEHSNAEDHSQQKANEDLTSAKRSYMFEEHKYLEIRAANHFETFLVVALRSEMESCETMFSETMNFKNFSELVVSRELTLVDDSFKALPVPIHLDHEPMKPFISLIEEAIKLLEPQHSSVSDGLYLDWCFLVEDHGSSNEDTCDWKFLQDVNDSIPVYDFDTTDLEMLVDKFVCSDDVTDRPYSKEDKENLKIASVFPSVRHGFLGDTIDADLRILMKDESRERGSAVPYESGSKNDTSVVESMSDFHDHEGLIPLESERRGESKLDSVNIAAEYNLGFSSELSFTCTRMSMKLNPWNINLHTVKMSNDMLDLINNLHESFAALLENDVGFSKHRYAPRTENGTSHHCISECKLQKWIQDKSTGKTGLSGGKNNDVLRMVLCAIKQTAWYLLYYGIHAAFIYINKLCTTMEQFRLKLSSLHEMIEAAYIIAENDIHKTHPSLDVVQEILQPHKSLKILIVADRVFWSPLKLLLSNMGLSYSDPHQHSPGNSHSGKGYAFPDEVVNAMLCTDCCLISHEFISPSFPVNKYGVILEYGGPLISSRLSTMFPSTHGCVLHFIKVDFGDSSICSTICDGVQMPKNINYKLDGGLHCQSALNWSTDKIQELLSFIPYQESSGGWPNELGDDGKTCCLMPANCVPSTLPKQVCTSRPVSPKNIIIVNTLNTDKDMIVCRRSTYRQILALEKKGSQIIERDLNIPVDAIINAAVCLAWYNSKNIGKKAALDDAISCLPVFVENLAASILTSLSFSFSGCIMVFEGGSSYIAGIMESSDELYAAAASLGIDLQLFYSYSSEMTDEIILSCIKVATKSARDLCPKMSDSETLAESFLTTFPSINPLSAHAISSTGGNLVNFLEWSPECRIRAVQRFLVPDESIALLSALSTFGEKENSLSGMTECSSSVSSVTDSENMHYKCNSESRKRKYMLNHQNVAIAMEDSVYEGSPELVSNRNLNPSGALGPFSSEIFDDFDKTNLSSIDEMFNQSQQVDCKRTMKHPSMTEQWDLFTTNGRSGISLEPEYSRSSCAPGCMVNGPEMLGVINEPQIPHSDKCFSSQPMSKMRERNKRIDICNKTNSGKMKDGIGEVINIDDTDYFRDGFDADYLLTWSKQHHDMDRDTTPRMFYDHSLSPSKAGNHPTFPTAAEIASEGKRWFSEHSHGKRSGEGITQQSDIVSAGPLEECVLQNNDMSFDDPSIPCRRTPLSNAIESNQLQQGSPWTIEFLNRMREKSKQKRQSNPSAISSLSCGSAWDEPKTTKRKSPSLLESYKFQGGKTTKNGIELKRQSRFVKPSNAFKAEKPHIPIAPSWSPVDKRARRKLSFSTNGNGGQSKLVWER